MARHTNLTSLFNDVATAIQSKTGSSEPIKADDFDVAIETIEDAHPEGYYLSFDDITGGTEGPWRDYWYPIRRFMTWREFINSSYNTIGLTCPSPDSDRLISYNSDYIRNGSGFVVLDDIILDTDLRTHPLLGGNGPEYTVYDHIPPCFIAGTKVTLDSDGNQKNIEEIKYDELVLSYDFKNKRFIRAKVVGIKVTQNVENLSIMNFGDNKEIIFTKNHPFLTKEGFKAIDHEMYPTLTESDTLIGKNLVEYTINSIQDWVHEPVTTYNLNVQFLDEDPDINTDDNFIANGLIVHNY